MKIFYHNAKVISKGSVFAGSVLAEGGVITDVIASAELMLTADKQIDLGGNYLAPGFIDTHIHGAGGCGTDTGRAQDLLALSELLLKQGVVAFAPTLYAAPMARMLADVKRFAAVIGQEKGAKIIGLHLEGPFLSPARPGAMNPGDLRPINIDDITALWEAAAGKICAMTAAPELPGFDTLAAFAKAKNFVLQIGHTNATYEQALAAAARGATHATHLFNAMAPLSAREPGAAGEVLTDSRFSAEIIADGAHVHPAMVKLALMQKGPDNIVLVSDSLTPAGAQSGAANGAQVRLEGGAFKRADGVLAGSALTMLGAVQNLIKWGYPPQYASMAASDNPARLHNLNLGTIAKGKKAQFTLLDKDFNLLRAGDLL